jgi:hypothetical protein
MEVSACLLYTWGESRPGAHWIGNSVVPRGGQDMMVKIKFLPLAGTEPWSSSQQHSHCTGSTSVENVQRKTCEQNGNIGLRE